MTRHQAEIAGRRTSWSQAGQGRPVVLIHGFPLGAAMWRPQLDSVPHGTMVIAPDLPGFATVGAEAGVAAGPAAGPAPATSMDEFADGVLGLMRHLGIEQAVIGGLSMGGYVTFALYRKAPQRFRAMLLADTKAEPDSAENRAGRDKMQAAVREKGAPAAADAMLPKLLRPANHGGPLTAEVREIILRNDAATIIGALEALKTRPDSVTLLAQITCPTLVLCGKDDELTTVAMSETIAKGVTNATLQVIPEAAHMSNLEQPEVFNTALWSFVANH